MRKKIQIIITLMAFILPIVAQENTVKVQHLNLKKIEKKKFSDRIFRQILVGEQGNIAVYELKKGADIPEHQHPQEQFTYIQKGKVEITIQSQKYLVKTGEIIIIPGNVPHSFIALEDTIDIDFFAPKREQEWLDGTSSFLKNSR